MVHKFREVFALSIKYYFQTLYISLGFGLVLIALLNTLADINFSLYFGNLTYTFLTSLSLVYIVPTIVLAALINAVFLTLLIFIVRKHLLQEHRRVYVLEFIKRHATYVFLFNLILYFVLFIIYLIFVDTKVAFLIPILSTILLFLTFYTCQSIVIDEKHYLSGISYGLHFLKNNIGKTVFILLILTLIYLVIALISYYFNFGFIISLILYTIVFYPFSEILKTSVYLTKFDIFKSYL
jgi:hypothetical protein